MRLHGERSGDIGLSFLDPKVDLGIGPARTDERLLDVDSKQATCLLSEKERLIEAPLAESTGVQWHRDERVDLLQLCNRGGQWLTEMRRSCPLALIFELNDSAAQPTVKWSD